MASVRTRCCYELNPTSVLSLVCHPTFAVMTLRVGLGRLLRALQSPAERARDGIRPFDAVGFSALSPDTTAERLVLVGEAAPNEAIASVVSSVFCAPAFTPSPLAEVQDPSSRPGVALLPVDKTNPAALGTAYKAAWTFHRATTETRVSFQTFLRRAIEATTEADSRIQSQAHVAEVPSGPSHAGTFASSSAASGPAPSLLSLGGPDRSHLSTAGSSLTPYETQGYKLGYAEASQDRPLGGHGDISDGNEGDAPGLSLMAAPDEDLHKYYASSKSVFRCFPRVPFAPGSQPWRRFSTELPLSTDFSTSRSPRPVLPEFVRLKRCALKGLV